MRQMQLAGVEVRLSGGTDGDGGGDGPVLVLMHGYGAPSDDLVPLARELRLPERVRLVFPRGILPLAAGGFFYPAAEPRAWWPVDLMALQNALAAGKTRVLAEDYPEGLAAARCSVISLLDALQNELGVESSRIVLGGFSQGAIVSCDVALHDTRPLAGIAVLSGTMVGEAVWKPRIEARRGMAVFQSHGRADPLLPFSIARELHQQLTLALWRAEFVECPGGHSIAVEALVGLRAFLLRVFGGLTP